MDLSAWQVLLYILIANAILAAVTETGRNFVKSIFRLRDSTSDSLIGAVKRGDVDRLRELLASESGDVNAIDVDGRNALHHATQRGNVEAVKLLIDAGCSIETVYFNRSWQQHRTPLVEALCRPSTEIALLLLDHGADPMNERASSPIHIAANQAQYDVVARLLDLGVPVDQPDSQGWTPLFSACGAQYVAEGRFESDFKERNLRTVKTLVDRGADIHYSDSSGRTCLNTASKEVAEYLRQCGTA